MEPNEKYNLVYLHHQWSDEAHTLQFCSTGEYFETPEYELQTPVGVWVTLWFRFICWDFAHSKSISTKLCLPKFRRAVNFGRIDHQAHDLESLRIFFCDRAHVYTLCEKYIQPFLRTLEASKINIFFFVTEFYGHSRWPTWTEWYHQSPPGDEVMMLWTTPYFQNSK